MEIWTCLVRPFNFVTNFQEVGNGNLTIHEQRTHFNLWALSKSPLLIGTHVLPSPNLINEVTRPFQRGTGHPTERTHPQNQSRPALYPRRPVPGSSGWRNQCKLSPHPLVRPNLLWPEGRLNDHQSFRPSY